MVDFSIELASERIYDPRTRNYFNEVLGSYINGNYRSAIVMLWTVVICDLVYKLQQMRDVYGDAKAAKLLDDIEEIQKQNPKSPDWEEKLLSLVRERTVLLEEGEFIELQHLQQQRHLSAHPVLNQTQLLHSPNQETTRALIRNALESLLLKPPILTNKVIETFVEDIAAKKDVLPDERSLKRYVETKYLKNLKSSVENSLFAALWKFVFRLSNSDTDTNRQINLRTLHILYRRRPTEIVTYIRDHSDKFSNINESFLSELIIFLGEHPQIYESLNDAVHTVIENATRENVSLFISATFLSDSRQQHLDELFDKINVQITERYEPLSFGEWKRIIEMFKDVGHEEKLVDKIIEIYINSPNYDLADHIFESALDPVIALINEEQAKQLLQGIEDNRQTSDRRRAKRDHNLLKVHFDEILGVDFDYSKYTNFDQ
jgi:hypothetical protein